MKCQVVSLEKLITMNGFLILTLVALASAVVGQEELLNKKCAQNDVACAKSGFQSFLKNTASGYPQYDIKPFDPLAIDYVKVDLEDVSVEFKDVKITGFKEQEVSEFEAKKDTDKFVSKANIAIESTAYLKGETEHTGHYNIKATILGSATYPKEEKKNDGKTYIVLGDETITCEVEGTPEFDVAESITSALSTDSVLEPFKKKFVENKAAARKQILCGFVKASYKAIAGNLRKFLAAVPKEDLYKH